MDKISISGDDAMVEKSEVLLRLVNGKAFLLLLIVPYVDTRLLVVRKLEVKKLWEMMFRIFIVALFSSIVAPPRLLPRCSLAHVLSNLCLFRFISFVLISFRAMFIKICGLLSHQILRQLPNYL